MSVRSPGGGNSYADLLKIKNPIARANAVLRREHSRYYRTGDKCDHTGQGVNYSNPLEELEEMEEREAREAQLDALELVANSTGCELPESFLEKIKAAALEHFVQYQSQFIEWIFKNGPHPIEVEKRLYIFAKHVRAPLVFNMGFRAIGALYGEEGATVHARSKAALGPVPAGWKKKAAACEKMAASAIGNRNRHGGKKTLQSSFLRKLKVKKQPDQK